MSENISRAVARVQTFLDVCGTPSEPIALSRRYDDEGRMILGSTVRLFAGDVRELLDTVTSLMQVQSADPQDFKGEYK